MENQSTVSYSMNLVAFQTDSFLFRLMMPSEVNALEFSWNFIPEFTQIINYKFHLHRLIA